MTPARNAPCPCGSGTKYKHCCGRDAGAGARGVAQPQGVASVVQVALNEHAAGRLERAEALYREALRGGPSDADAARIRFHLALVLQAQDRTGAAIGEYRAALALEPRLPEAHVNLGGLLKRAGSLGEAIEHYRAAVRAAPSFAEAHGNLGHALHAAGDFEAAEACLRKAVALKPHYADALLNLGHVRLARGDAQGAIAQYRAVLSLDPNDADALDGLGRALLVQGRAAEALECAQRSLRLREAGEAKRIAAEALRDRELDPHDAEARRLLARALDEPWSRPADLVATAVSLLERDDTLGPCIARAADAWPRRLPADELFAGDWAMLDDELLCRLLESAPACGVRIERFLASARACLLDAAMRDGGDADATTFQASLARQCFVNEYVYPRTGEETARASELRGALEDALASGQRIAPLRWVAGAAYFPLGELAGAETLLRREWRAPIAALVAQQIAEPRAQRAAAANIAAITPLDDATSLRVRDQYERNPYPRWIKCPPEQPRSTIDAMLATRLGRAPRVPWPTGAPIDILIAGCGTGLQAIDIAQRVIAANVLAVDLSRASLGYAAAKSREMALSNIEYAQADLLRLAQCGRSFDLVLADGVLHHLADPLAGWRALCSVLRHGGLMHVSLYSEAARAHVVAARRFIAERGYAPTAEGIRECRQALIAAFDSGPMAALAQSTDFFVTSGCRDLLFHEQEHRFTFPQIAECVGAVGLRLLGVDAPPATMRAFRERYPGEGATADLECWHRFERDHPQAFRTMIPIWLQKPGG